ncbi:phospho-sugar mutase [Rothia sp. ZJ1223]|uniref:phospho-sugar mutase n=1 Tax=Rothia sp. ZJ1223 TaxID=2811098 RepID=UPI00195D2E63|nr:phospho-sugar mutase [Rothia sp. ZJ1223]MBM7051375.1 phospho-sugar mutase [Rothia sp. ZJ1223]
MTDFSQVLTDARTWVEIDPDEVTRTELSELIAAAEADENSPAARDLAERFSGTLQFGTAGLRAELGAGPMRMNQVVVSRAAAGLALYATERAEKENWQKITAVVGFDARYNSDIFAQLTAQVFTAAGIETTLMPAPLPTPVLAWATKEYDAEIGVMVTASHNPAADNGYKVYLGGKAVGEGERGTQIVPPYDADIAACITRASAQSIERAENGWKIFGTSIADDYAKMVGELEESRPRDLSIVYTPVHGVGGKTLTKVLNQAGFSDVHVVEAQAQPDPDFPTAAFPNPEEPGVLDLALELAREVDADLMIANDPDADRAAFAIQDAGAWRMLRGDEVGAIFGAIMLNKIQDPSQAVFANSIVSSRLLGAMATANGVEHRETLTGFKWISRVPNLTYGYEEALGYCIDPARVQDKDGISAALVMADFAQDVKDRGGSLAQVLADIATEYGLYATDQLSVRVEDLSLIQKMMMTLRTQTPTEIAGSRVVEYRDLAKGSEQLPPTDGLLFLTEDNTRVIVRPSGTEPKLKCYIEVVTPVESSLDNTRLAATQQLIRIKEDLAAVLGL